MFGESQLPVFMAASVAVLLAPGPSVLYVVARSLNQGRKAGVVCVLGLETGTLIHLAAASLGISALLLTSALAFDAIRCLGAAYLVYLGVRKLFERGPTGPCNDDRSAGLRSVFRQGVLVEMLNPTTALFFMAFLPQFVDRSRDGVAQQTLLLGLVFIGLATFIEGAYALLAGTFSQGARQSSRLAQAQRLLAASLFIGLGVGAALGSASMQ